MNPMMKPRELLDAIDDEQLIAALHRAEARTGATIRIYISHQVVPDIVKAARQQFKRFKAQNPDSKGRLLIFVAPRSRNFALHGDVYIHDFLDAGGWNQLTETLSTRFKVGDFTGGLIAVIDAVAARVDATAGPPQTTSG